MGIPISQVAAGFFHSFILSQSAAVYGWGRNRLVLLKWGVYDYITAGIPISQVAAGFFHSFIISQSRAVYGWGRNRLVLLKWGV